ncbi:MAG: proline dehydrogenase family protein [Acidobacteria bacterium]|nr:proline dehydrogenase family protein [Acidobacteriota bacterium]
MGVMRTLLLKGSQSTRLREMAPRYRFVRKAVERFMPGERLEDALNAARTLQQKGVTAILTHLGENLVAAAEAEGVTAHYLDMLARVKGSGLDAQVSVKLTQLGLDQSVELCERNMRRLVARAAEFGNMVWTDMESSPYVDRTLDLFRRVRRDHANVGVCLQAYLRRTAGDLEALLPLAPAIRIVKGAYNEPAEVAFPSKRDVDTNFLALAKRMLPGDGQARVALLGIGTHNRRIIRELEQHAERHAVPRERFEFEMLYGIQRAEQVRLASAGQRIRVLISYGEFWFPWFMRRLAERPANVMFVVRNVFG